MDKELKWNIDIEKIKDKRLSKVKARYDQARSQMMQRTYHHELYGLLAKNKSIHQWSTKKGQSKYFSEGSTQYILRKVLADTIQRMPDGELTTQYDKSTWQHVITQYLFENKVMWSEYEGIDMLSNFTNTFKMSFVYAFAPVRTGFERDVDGDIRISYNLENWADVFVDRDCRDIRRPAVVYHRSYLSKDQVEELLNEDGSVKDSSYCEDTIKYILDHDMFGAKQWESEKLSDKLKNSTALQSIELVTEYKRGASEFVTFVPELNAPFRKVKNYDPRKGLPWNFFVLEPDPDFPLGVSQVEFLLSDQQFNDLFQTSAYKNLLLAMEPPIMVSGWETNPSSYVFEPRRIWNLGNNPNQVKVDPVKIDNTVLNNWTTTREAVASSMLRNLNVMDGTIAKDSGTSFSKTAPGVKAQQEAKTININQYQKRLENFISQWATQALQMYISAMGGEHDITVDEATRRRLFDIGCGDMITIDDKVTVDFDELSTNQLRYQVRVGSLVQLKEDQERAALSEVAQPFVQNLNGWSEENRKVIENEVLLPIAKRLLELSNVDIAQTMADSLSTQIAKTMMADMQNQIDQQGAVQQQQGQQIADIQNQMQEQPGAMPQEPIPEGFPSGLPPVEGEALSPGAEPSPTSSSKTPDQQVVSPEDLLEL